MYNIKKLEAQWRRYRRRQILRHGLTALGILLVLGLPIFYVTLKPLIPSKTEAKATQAVRTAAKNSRKNPTIPSKAKEMQSKAVTPLKPELPSAKKETTAHKKQNMFIDFSGEASKTSTPESTQGKIEINIVKKVNTNVVKEIEKRFHLSQNYDDAMYLAKYYYAKRLYKKAEYWAIQANTIDSTKPESWIIFGKAKAKQGYRIDALRALQQYYDNTENMEVKTLIDKIRKEQKF